MRLAGTARHHLMTAAAVLGVLAVAGASVAWRAGGASATQAPVVLASQPRPEPPTTSTTVPTTSSSSTSTTSTSTSTTVKPKPVPTTAATPRTTVPRPAAPPATPAPPAWTPPVAQPSGASAAERCTAAQQWVAQHGVVLPAGWGFRCPGTAMVSGAERWGLACWNCEGNGTNWIAVDIGRIGSSDNALRYVIAHETCHAIDYMTLGITTEVSADLCAALHGAPRP